MLAQANAFSLEQIINVVFSENSLFLDEGKNVLIDEFGKDYHGRIERIDSYDKKKDIFVTLQLIPRKNWDDNAEEIFEFNHFVKNRKSE
jgi:hypothetical protein